VIQAGSDFNAISTIALLIDTYVLAHVLAGLSARAVEDLLVDVALIAVSNILIFSLWFWIADPPGVEGGRARRSALGLPLPAARGPVAAL